MTRVILEQRCFIDCPLENLMTKSLAVKFGLESKNLNGFTEVKKEYGACQGMTANSFIALEGRLSTHKHHHCLSGFWKSFAVSESHIKNRMT
jgi:hypothetical protein